MKLRIATRGSNLALVQTRWVGEQLRAHFPDVSIEEVHVRTKGDRIQDRPLAQVGGKGLFVSEVEAVVVRGEADIAVHSLKDVPGDVPLAEGMGILSVPVREDPRNVLNRTDDVLKGVDLILLDYKMPGMDGLSLLAELRKKECRARCILISAFLNDDVRQQARLLGVDRVREKPVDIGQLRGALTDLLPAVGRL